MTLTIELTPEQEAKLRGNARATGMEPTEYIVRLIDGAPIAKQGLLPGKSLLDGLRRIGVVGAFRSEPRPDGRAWSDVEGFE